MQAFLTVDLGFGDAGKGSVIDWLVRHYKVPWVIRYCGGAQAAHNVVLPSGEHHTFAQFGSGTFAGARTYLARRMMVSPGNFLQEAAALGNLCNLQKVVVDDRCPITTPFHRAANQVKEIIRNAGRHGSCGLGIGETAADVAKLGAEMLYAGDLEDPLALARKLRLIRSNKYLELEDQFKVSRLIKESDAIASAMRAFESTDIVSSIVTIYKLFMEKVDLDDGTLLADILMENVAFEGAQGVLLDEDYGFFPYVTRSKTTLAYADKLLKDFGYDGEVHRLGILRSYAVRHGPGPFVSEDEDLRSQLVEAHNIENTWQGKFRAGWFDAVSARYAAALTGVSDLVLTCMDQAPQQPKICVGYSGLSDEFYSDGLRILSPDLNVLARRSEELMKAQPIYEDVADLVMGVEDSVGVPVRVLSAGPTYQEKTFV